MTKTVYVVGNAVDPRDRFPMRLLPSLRHHFPEIAFLPFDPTEEFPPHTPHLVLIDTVEGISRVTLFSDTDEFSFSPRVSVHDYDLPIHLSLLKKLGKLEKLTIVGIPTSGDRKNVLSDLSVVLSSIEYSRNATRNSCRGQRRE